MSLYFTLTMYMASCLACQLAEILSMPKFFLLVCTPNAQKNLGVRRRSFGHGMHPGPRVEMYNLLGIRSHVVLSKSMA